jgi:hypothetical protein
MCACALFFSEIVLYCNNRICSYAHTHIPDILGSRKLYFLFTVTPIMT